MASRQEQITQLGLYGVIPFIAAAVALWISPVLMPQYIALDFHQFALVYGGLVIVFLAGVSAGAIIIANAPQHESFLPSIMIALTALVVVMPSGTFFFSIGAAVRHTVILVLLIYLLMRDLNYVRAGIFPAWYGNLRSRMTLWAGLSLILIIGRLFVWGFY